MSDAVASPSPSGGAVSVDWSDFQRVAAEWGCEPMPLPAAVENVLLGVGLSAATVRALAQLSFRDDVPAADPDDEFDHNGPKVSSANLLGGHGFASAKCRSGRPGWCLAAGLFEIGSACNGDFLAVDLRDEFGATGWVGHESGGEDVRESFAPMYRSPAEFLRAMSNAAGEGAEPFPMDYYETDHFKRKPPWWRSA